MSDVRKCKGGIVRTESKDLAPHQTPFEPIEPDEPLSYAIKRQHAPWAGPKSIPKTHLTFYSNHGRMCPISKQTRIGIRLVNFLREAVDGENC